jgi:hypothetical protein
MSRMTVTYGTFQDGEMWSWVVWENGVRLCTGGMWPTARQAAKDGQRAANRAMAANLEAHR